MKEKILALADKHPAILGFQGIIAYLTFPYLPQNYDLTDKTLEDVLGEFPEEHLRFIYDELAKEYEGR